MATAKPKSSIVSKKKTFNDLTEKDLSFIRKITSEKQGTWTERMDVLSKHFGGVDEKTVRNWMRKHNMTAPTIVEPEEYTKAKKRKTNKKSVYYIVTWAQSSTPIHKEFWKNIQAYAKFLNAEIHVILGRYKNPTSIFPDRDKEYWSPEILPYADANRHDIHKYFSILSDIKISPTATYPLSSLEQLTNIKSCVVGHSRVDFQCLPKLEGYKNKLMFSTGALTVENYTDSKAGKKGEFHHTFGFTLIEIKDKETFFARQITATNKGTFQDVFYSVENGVVYDSPDAISLVCGDIHCGETCELVSKQQIKLANKINPKTIVLHDIFNGHSISHHESKDFIKQYDREVTNTNSLENEINGMYKYLDPIVSKYNVIFPSCNHNDWIDRKIRSNDLTTGTIKNFKLLTELTSVMLEGKAKKGIIAYLLEKRYGKKIKALGRNDSYSLCSVELSQHGDLAQNSAKGSPISFAKLNTRLIVGHSHTPYRHAGVIYVGTSTNLRQDYNKGMSSWLNSDAIITANGKIIQIHYLDEKTRDFTTMKY